MLKANRSARGKRSSFRSQILHQGIRYIEQGIESEPKLLIYRAKYLAKQLRKFG